MTPTTHVRHADGLAGGRALRPARRRLGDRAVPDLHDGRRRPQARQQGARQPARARRRSRSTSSAQAGPTATSAATCSTRSSSPSIVTVAQVVTSVLSAYAFAILEFPGRNVLFVAFLATMLVPLEATLVVNRQTVDSLGWLNTYQGLAVPFLATAFGTFLIRQVFLTLPRDLRDAAAIDGVGHLGFLRHVAVPLVRPTIGALAALAFLSTWNQYLWPNLITTEADMYTLQSGLRFLSQSPLDEPEPGDGRGDHRLPADHRRAAGLPAPARARPHVGWRQGMSRPAVAAAARRRACSWPPAGRVSRSSRPATIRRRRRPHRRAGPARDRGAGRDAAADHDRRRSPRRRRRRWRRCRRAPSTRSTTSPAPVEITFWHGLASTIEDGADRPHRRVQRQPGQGARAPREPGRLQADDRQVRPEQPGRAGRTW